MEWVVIGATAGIVTFSAFAGASLANWFNGNSVNDNSQNTKIAKLESEISGVNINIKNSSNATGYYNSTTVGLLVLLCVIQLILAIIVITWVIKKCRKNRQNNNRASTGRRNSYELHEISTRN